MTTLEINLTDEDIQEGMRYSARKCPLAKAISRATKNWACVGPMHVLLPQCGGNEGYALPEVAWKFREAFDSGKAVEPISFTLEVDSE